VTIASLGLAWTYGLDAASFLAVLAALLLMHARPGAAAVGGERGWRAAIEGLRFIRRNPIIMAVMGLDFGATFWGSATVLLPVFADDILHVGPQGLGVLFAAPAVGAVVGAVGMTLRHQILQMLTPDALRGRVTAANQVFVQGGPQLGQLEAGAVAAAFSTPISVASGGIACVITVLAIAWAVPAIRRYEIEK
jgi:hypothetical protein